MMKFPIVVYAVVHGTMPIFVSVVNRDSVLLFTNLLA